VSGRARLSAEIVNQRGLHARASAKFVKLAAGFDAVITVSRDGQTVEACSIMGLMMLAAGLGAVIEIAAEGPDAKAAVAALGALVAARFDEEK
jgi:phosphocarrier protein